MLNTRYRPKLWTLLLFLLIFGVSVGAQSTVKVAEGKETVIEMTASNMKFEPDVVRAQVGDNITLDIKNIASGSHNFTLKDPKGQVMKSVDLSPNQTATVKISLKEAGVYEFYCDKPFHATMGMKGRLEVAP